MNRVVLSDTNRTPIVQIITYFTLVTSLLAFVTHAGIKLYVFRALRIESWFVLAALVPAPSPTSGFSEGLTRTLGLLYCTIHFSLAASRSWLRFTDAVVEQR